MINRPSIYLLVMTLWWSIPFFIMSLLHYPLVPYLSSYLLYFSIFGATITLIIFINVQKFPAVYWESSSRTRKYFFMCILYSINMIAILVIALSLSHFRLLEYFGGDPEGSIGMLFIPTIVGYFLLGFAYVFITDWSKLLLNYLKRSKQEVLSFINKLRVDSCADS